MDSQTMLGYKCSRSVLILIEVFCMALGKICYYTLVEMHIGKYLT